MTHRSSCRLPDKPSQLILLALADLGKAERSLQHQVHMSAWHSAADLEPPLYDPVTCKTKMNEHSGRCTVCLAGSVIAFSLKAPPTVELSPDSYPPEVRRKLFALNELREGEIEAALTGLRIPAHKRKEAIKATGAAPIWEGGSCRVRVAQYSTTNAAKFKIQLRTIAKQLASVGL